MFPHLLPFLGISSLLNYCYCIQPGCFWFTFVDYFGASIGDWMGEATLFLLKAEVTFSFTIPLNLSGIKLIT